MSQDNWPYPTTPEPKRSSAPLAWVLVGVVTVALTATALVAVGTLQDRDTMIANQHTRIGGLEGDLADLTDDLDEAEEARDECEAEAEAYRDATGSLATEFYDYLDAYPWGSLDLTDANDAIDEANELGCLS